MSVLTLLVINEKIIRLNKINRQNLIKSFQKEGKTIMLTTHYMEEAEELCDRVAN